MCLFKSVSYIRNLINIWRQFWKNWLCDVRLRWRGIELRLESETISLVRLCPGQQFAFFWWSTDGMEDIERRTHWRRSDRRSVKCQGQTFARIAAAKQQQQHTVCSVRRAAQLVSRRSLRAVLLYLCPDVTSRFQGPFFYSS